MDKVISADKLFQALRDDYNIPGACLARVKRHIDAAPAVDAVAREDYEAMKTARDKWKCAFYECAKYKPAKMVKRGDFDGK